MLLVLLLACSNPCQQICKELAAYAQDDCGLTVSDDEVASCEESLVDLPDGRAAQCAEVNDPDQIREWWTCDDVAANFQNAAK